MSRMPKRIGCCVMLAPNTRLSPTVMMHVSEDDSDCDVPPQEGDNKQFEELDAIAGQLGLM